MLDEQRILEALHALNDELSALGVHGEVCLVGGAVMCVAYRARPATKDVDAWFVPTSEIRAAAEKVAGRLGLERDWLNDAAKGYLSERAKFVEWLSLSHLDVRIADGQTMLAMKCLAARGEQDAEDIRVLAEQLGLGSAADILGVVTQFYDPERIHIRTRLLLEEMFGANGG